MRRLLPVLIFLAGMLLAGVFFLLFHKSEPSIDWNGPQKEAAILLSDPQLYSREALINDRRHEAEFLRRMLEASSQEADRPVEFRPQLQKIVETTRALRAQVNLPDLIALPAQNKTAAGDGQRETASPAPESETPRTGEPDKNASGTRESGLTSPKGNEKQGQRDALLDDPRERFRDLQSYRADIRAALAEVNLDDRHDYGGQALYRLQFRATVLPGQNPAKFGVAEVRIRPPKLQDEDYRRIYLAWLLYATQRLNASSSRLIPAPSYVVSDTGTPKSDDTSISSSETDARYEALSQGSDVVKVLDICPQRIRDAKQLCLVNLALPPQGAESVERFLKLYDQMRQDIRKAQNDAKSVSKELHRAESIPNPDPCEQEADTKKGTPPLLQYYSNAKQVYANMPYIAASLASFKQVREPQASSEDCFEHVPQPQASSKDSSTVEMATPIALIYKMLFPFMSTFETPPTPRLPRSDYYENVFILRSAERCLLKYFSVLEQQYPRACNKVILSVTAERKNTAAPPQFREKLNELLREQRPYSYAMTPTELTQRVSNMNSAVTTLDLALKLANPKAEAGGGEKVKRTIEGIERYPRIVGFADREPDTPPPDTRFGWRWPPWALSGLQDREPDTPSASFGWVFGPRLQSNTNMLEHPVADYNVSVDVAVPGWWPRIELELRTVWVANWHNTRHVLQDTPSRNVTVPMPLLTPPDLESLTEIFTRKLIGPWGKSMPPISVTQVFPRTVSACMKEVTFVIEGENLWRDPEVYWEGVRADNVTLLPGMRGIAANFQTKKLFDAELKDLQKQQFRRTFLIIALRNGPPQVRAIDFYGHRRGKDHEECEGPTVSAEAYDPRAPTIHSVAPSMIYACSFSPLSQFLISGVNLGVFKQESGEATPGEVLFGTAKGQAELLRSKDPLVAMLKVSFSNLDLSGIPKDSKIPLTVATHIGLDSKDVTVHPCK